MGLNHDNSPPLLKLLCPRLSASGGLKFLGYEALTDSNVSMVRTLAPARFSQPNHDRAWEKAEESDDLLPGVRLSVFSFLRAERDMHNWGMKMTSASTRVTSSPTSDASSLCFGFAGWLQCRACTCKCEGGLSDGNTTGFR